jgi:3-dehydroquinate dehydratase-2
MPTFLILNGPNLNLLGKREPDIYGTETLADIQTLCEQEANKYGVSIDFRQSNHEGELVSWLHEAREKHDAVILNAGAYSHTSVAILDALQALPVPVIEVHLSNIYKREAFRHHSFVSAAAKGVICGLGSKGYVLAVQALAETR